MATTTHDPRLAQMLVLDELFDLSLYKALRAVTQPDVHATLDELITAMTDLPGPMAASDESLPEAGNHQGVA